MQTLELASEQATKYVRKSLLTKSSDAQVLRQITLSVRKKVAARKRSYIQKRLSW